MLISGSMNNIQGTKTVIVICIISLQIFVIMEKTIYRDFVGTSSTFNTQKVEQTNRLSIHDWCL